MSSALSPLKKKKRSFIQIFIYVLNTYLFIYLIGGGESTISATLEALGVKRLAASVFLASSEFAQGLSSPSEAAQLKIKREMGNYGTIYMSIPVIIRWCGITNSVFTC